MTTTIQELNDDAEYFQENDLHLMDKKKPETTIFDMDITLKTRIAAYNLLLQRASRTKDYEKIIEVCNRLNGMYIFSQNTFVKDFLREVCIDTKTPQVIKIQISEALCTHDDPVGCEVTDNICKKFSPDVSNTLRVEIIRSLFYYSDYVEQAKKYLFKIINDKNIDTDFRYKSILSLERLEVKDIGNIIMECMLIFFMARFNPFDKKILAAQYILSNELEDKTRRDIENALIKYGNNTTIDYNTRADAMDILLKYGKYTIDKAKNIIEKLGRENQSGPKTIFTNAQNAHYEEFSKAFMKGLEFLAPIELKDKNRDIITFDKVKSIIKQDKQYNRDIEKSFERINLDRALYSRYQYTLETILLKVWAYIEFHKCKEELYQRLIEELQDMSGLCSSGLAERLVNVLSGFGDFNYTITWRDQIRANIHGRLNAKINNILEEWDTELRMNKIIMIDVAASHMKYKDGVFYEDAVKPEEDEQYYKYQNVNIHTPGIVEAYTKFKNIGRDDILIDFQCKVLEEMTIESNSHKDRVNFSTFFGDVISEIRETMWGEFKEHIEQNKFDEWFRDGMSSYEQ